MSEKLEPCPFCGGNAEIDTLRAYRSISTGDVGNEAAIYCLECTAEISFCYADAPGISKDEIVADLVEKWNTRAPDRLREALEEISKEAEFANNVISQGLSRAGQGHTKVATSMHRIAVRARAALKGE